MSLTSLTEADPAEHEPAVALPPELAAKLSEPAVVEALTSLLSHADLVALLVEGLDGLIGRSDEIIGTLGEGIGELRTTVDSNDAVAGAKSVNIGEIAGSLRDLAGVLPQTKELTDPATLAQLGVLARGLASGAERYRSDPVPISGVVSLVKLMKDPEISAALSYAATVLRAVGRELESK